MLTDNEIKSFIKLGKIKIDPFEEELVETANYRVRLGSKLLIPKENQRVILNDSSSSPDYSEFDHEKENYVLKPKEFILGQTYERIGLAKDVAAILDGRSTLARLGVTIHQSSQFIPSGQDYHVITLEIYNAGNFEIELVYKSKVGKLIFRSEERRVGKA